jgi:hypothetical protein
LTFQSLQAINKYGANLQSLTLGSSAFSIFDQWTPPDGSSVSKLKETPLSTESLEGPKALKKLVCWNLNLSVSTDLGRIFSNSLIRYADTLTWLDISGTEEINCFGFLRHFQSLVALVLYNVDLKGSNPGENGDRSNFNISNFY